MKGRSTLTRILLSLLVMALLALSVPLAGLAAPASAPPEPVTFGKVPTPDEFVGFEVGSDYNLVDYKQSVAYFRAVAEASNRVVIQDIGESTLGLPMVEAIISAPHNLAKLDRYREIQKKLADPTLMAPGEAEKLLAEAKPVVSITTSTHSTEIAGSQMVLKLLYNLAASNSPEVQEILDNVILLLNPCSNPDGQQMEVEWYRKYLKENEDWASSGVPWLYHYYAGHDDNRDWYMFNLKETQAIGRIHYQEWFPEIIYDIHQMGNRGARLFVPPYFDPPNPALDPITLRSHYLLGGHITTDLVAKGFKGVSTNAQYDPWYHGAARAAPGFHNMVGILTEAASTRLATPIYQEWKDLTGSTRGLADGQHMLVNFPQPWEGGWWRLSDIMAYEESVAMSILTLAARYGDSFVRNYYESNVRGIKGEYGSILSPDKNTSPADARAAVPFAYVIPMDQQRDPVVTAKFLNILLFQGIQVHRAEAPFNAGGVSYPAGSYVVLTRQPTRANVLALLGPQYYPDRRNPDGSPERPYDMAGWTLSMLMGVNSIEVPEFSADLTRVKEVPFPAGKVEPGEAKYGYVFGPELNNAAVARFRLLEAGFELQWVMEGATIGGRSFAPGATIVKAKAGLDAKVAALAKELGVTFYPVNAAPTATTKKLTLPRIGFYNPWSGNADQGWRRYVLDDAKIPYTELRNADIQAGDLGSKYDVILIPDQSRSSLLNGIAPGSMPPEYTGGIGTSGADALKAFVNGGGTLLTFGNGYQFAMTDLGVPVTNALQGVSSSQFYCPGSVLTANVDNTNPVGFGMGNVADIYYYNNATFNVTDPSVVKTVVSYGTGDLLRSGWLLGQERIQGKAAVVAANVGNGKVVMSSFPTTWRAETHGTYKLFFNSLFYATAK